ncbi:uracil-DNA glycosylase [Arthrobacter agilis]|uniref:uracil-DNA glycosylase n=1 Tax=Arthrobacter agilis TaxID=37921 RepID=UPI000B3644D7|nr:uracil-DNA glycosylase [Arthrobacter agilis]OUM40756.1 uracil-DNA glycosylase [Arthrobacter agilis]PPB45362.1 uracil-DNA glycosylase [Arthrobacter agilis]TPV28071.1 uracil-DNA glycosylase [Arthrobacter agilis]VDR31228.1 Uracil-DNA glycosylase [Arthrobacter agilis]
MTHDDGALFDLPVTPAAGAPTSSADESVFPFAAPAGVADLVAPDWVPALEPLQPVLHALATALAADLARGARVLPDSHDILRAFTTRLAEVRVVIVGQDPYPTVGHAVGLSFSVHPAVRPVPRSLANIYRELSSDTGAAVPASGDLSGWAAQGVLLLNRVLTVRAGEAASHRGLGWEQVTDAAVRALVARGGPLVAVLWGKDAQRLKPLLGATPTIESAHPSPLSASRGFFGSRPFTRVNSLLAEQGADPIEWARTSAVVRTP